MAVPNLIKGFDLDCHALFVKFEQLSTVRFSAFAQVWREMKFSFIFNGRRIKELVCFTTEALSYTKYYFMNANSFLRKICALYIMYGLYYKQPIQYRSNILVTYDEWICIKDFVKELRESKHMDALIILLKLIFDNAFEHSATNYVRHVPTSCRGLIHTNYNTLKNVEGFNLNFGNEDFDKLEKEYKEIKQQLIEKNSSFLNYARDNITEEFTKILKTKTEEKDSTIIKPSTSKQTTAEGDRGEKRRTLRRKCFSKKSKSALYNSSVIQTNDEDD